MNIIQENGDLGIDNVDNCPKIQENGKTIKKIGKSAKIRGSEKIYSSPLSAWLYS